MDRISHLAQLDGHTVWDIIIIGGGATGLGIALDAATRGYRTLLLEARDFAKGTSSRSTKLLHGGVRYLAQGNIDLVMEALRERGRLAQNAPHLFHKQPFIIPCRSTCDAAYYTAGLWLYDRLAGKRGIGRTRYLGGSEARRRMSAVKSERLAAAVCYFDGQFDEARLAVSLAQTVADHGGTVFNYCAVTALQKRTGRGMWGACAAAMS
uniref:FAD-dependent oxidoreductase n=1 Tax=Conchiformibius kuhniae TaxID=211502 RepID=A0A8T9MX70_9NEIS|nr:FAD-dependent oxidoreductase [Conchiformibius kuhniae]